MTIEGLEAYRGRMSEEAFHVAILVVSGATMAHGMRELRIGSKRYLALAQEAERVVGQRLRRWRIGEGKPKRRVTRCRVCHLVDPHRCLEVSMWRAWDGEYPVPRGTD